MSNIKCCYYRVPILSYRILHPAPHVLTSILTSHELNIKSTQFSQQRYPCSVCLTEQKGSRCLKLPCSHIFCRACLEDFWRFCVLEGDVGRVGCPDPACVKEKSEVGEEEVRKILTEQEAERWKWLREKRAIEKGL